MRTINNIIRSLNFLSASNQDTVNAEGFPFYEEESITAVTATERAVKAVLTQARAKVRADFLTVLKVGSSQERAIAGYVYHFAYNQELDPVATQEWKLLSLAEQGDIQQAVRTSVFEIEGERDVRTPLCRFSATVAGLPTSPLEWENYPKVGAKLDVLATARPLPGLTRVIARSVYPLLTEDNPSRVFRHVHLPPWNIPDTRKGLVPVIQGYAEAFECWVEDRNKSKSGPLTRVQLFEAVNAVLREMRGTNRDTALVVGCRLLTEYGFTLEEIVTTSVFHEMLVKGWPSYPFGATALGILNIPVQSTSDSEVQLRRDWTFGFLSRFQRTSESLTEVERRDPRGQFNLQVADALALEDSVDRYISFNRIMTRFKGVVFVDPVDPKAGPVDLVANYPEKKKPELPSYNEVLTWREKNHHDYSPYLG